MDEFFWALIAMNTMWLVPMVLFKVIKWHNKKHAEEKAINKQIEAEKQMFEEVRRNSIKVKTQAVVPRNGSASICRYCGNIVPSGSVKCNSCGATLPKEKIEQVVDDAASVMLQNTHSEKIKKLENEKYKIILDNEKEKKESIMTSIIVIVGLFIVLAIVAMVIKH